MSESSATAPVVGGAARLRGEAVRVSYGDRAVLHDVDIAVPDGRFTVIIGPNACGKSTMLAALGRLLRPGSGSVVLDGKAIHSYSTKETARRLSLLPQAPGAPDGILVGDLVSRGRYPHQGLLRQWSDEDAAAVAEALAATGTTELRHRRVDELSGGQRQRVWIAMVLAQTTSIVLLDEPTTYLDISHQIDVLDLCERLYVEHGRTVVAVLHDLNLAARYATDLIAMRDGRVVGRGSPRELVTPELVREVFDLDCVVIDDPLTGAPMIVPGRRAAR
ncbi:ABC transporter ATP-binding protein [Nocardia puris]|uniref:ABC transporter ATP-binding protein n=1 Tax=Nocardia puris TaxID=208602 RepID=UPI0018937D27|nr:ABC transporter ATP-binding protein [Nocardia puris]MBF6213424.1 ABC transporter ATP-binding protein [Nocardia puris]MBF6369407.1 ABC transporter ATP-binding protein [Nocardia puris]MBF6462304.1 ABC transporter ATP-binding protein [Nocardia puris]